MTDDFFRSRLDSMIDLRHPLAVLATRMPWAQLEASMVPLFAHRNREGVAAEVIDLFGATAQLAGAGVSAAGRPRLPIRRMLGLLYLKHAFNESDLIVGARTLTGNPYDSHTLAAQLEQTRILLEAMPGDLQPKTVLADLGYRGVDAELGSVKLIHRGTYKTLSEKQRKWLKRRQAAEPIIGHVKQDHGLRRCWLKGATGDALHAVLCATGFNLRWLLRAIVRLGIGPVLLRLLRHVKSAAFAHYFLTIARQLRVDLPMRSPFRYAAALTCAIQLATRSRCAQREAVA
ncbi:IS5/IS1182 family transposase [Burkholderia ubonensis]|uniref:Transposase DDE domain-containing protein n=1 Tax=Burkholderia ubonensis TaxID=101571 RepID=A0A106IHY0_9BURK|nr:hypothetical protein WL16_10625 [Burkholderia ubonensis]KWA86273.1 hypothetical protein WL29_10955 [Burkholderia ubonensis]KWB95514.1 hypothetical protein WL43_32305 [Burkholderia ubonensis]KWZ58691.1 hypothetical protein WK57_16380 [Burkholderia ubonensis]